MKTVSLEIFSRLVSAVYAAAIGPRQWESALGEINHELDGAGGALFIPNGVPWYASTLPDDSGEAYRQYYHRLDRVAEATRRGPVGVVRTGTELMPLVRHSEFSDWLRPHDIDDALVARLSSESRPACVIFAASRRAEPFDAPERMKLVNGLIPHLRQAVLTHSRFAELARGKGHLAAALETIGHGVVIVDRNRLVTDVNAAAERVLRADDGLRIRLRHIVATSPSVDLLLQNALRDAVTGDGSTARSGRSLVCERPSRRSPYLVQVLPLRDADPTDPAGGTRALVLIKDPTDEPARPAALLRHLYGLTVAEADVAVRVAGGAELKEICDQLSVSIATVRKHLQHVFDKTDAHRQADLVRLLLTLDQRPREP